VALPNLSILLPRFPHSNNSGSEDLGYSLVSPISLLEVMKCYSTKSLINKATSQQSPFLGWDQAQADVVIWLLGWVSLHLFGDDCADTCFWIGCWLIQKVERLLQPWVTATSLDVQERRICKNHIITTVNVIFFQVQSLSPHLHTEQGKAALCTRLSYALRHWGLQSLSFLIAMTKCRWWFSLFHTTYYSERSLSSDLSSKMYTYISRASTQIYKYRI